MYKTKKLIALFFIDKKNYFCKKNIKNKKNTKMKLHKIETGNLKLDGGAMFGVVPKIMWQKIYPADENNLCNWSMRCLLVETDDKKILIDTGIGTKQDEKFLKHYHLNGEDSLEKSLKNAGFSFNDITDVVLTHLHFDHAGGAVCKTPDGELKPTFPNAIYHISKAQWLWATHANRREKASFLTENIMPLHEHNVVHLIENEGELFPDFELRIFNGHTDGQLIPIINFNGKKIAYMGDLLPSAAHIPMPFIMSYDTKPLVTLEDKERFFEEAIRENMILFFEHDVFNHCALLKKTEKGVMIKEVFDFDEINNKA